MAGGTQKLIDKVNSNASSATTITEVSQLAGVATILRGCNYDVVTSAACLPAAGNNVGRMVAIDSGTGDVCYRFSDGYNWKCDYDSTSTVLARELWVAGYNFTGHLGTGNITNYSFPVTTAGGGLTWCQVNSAQYHTGAIKTDGTLWMWGQGNSGKLGTGNTTSYSSPVTTIAGGTTWCQVRANQDETVAIKTDGTLWTWGENICGQLGTGNTTSYSSPVTTAGGGTNWCLASGGCRSIYGVKTDGTLWSWGVNNCGQLGDGTITTRLSPVTTAGGGTTWCQVSSLHCIAAAIKTDGTLWTWGNNLYGQLGDGTSGAGTTKSSPVTTVAGGTTWRRVSIGGYITSAIKTDGTLWTWGFNNLGQLGTGNTTCYSSPVTTAGGGTTWCQVCSGFCHAGAIKTDGTMWMWGSGFRGQFGIGNISNYASPVTAFAGSSWCQVSVGNYTTFAIKNVLKGF